MGLQLGWRRLFVIDVGELTSILGPDGPGGGGGERV